MKLRTEMVKFHGRMLPRSATPAPHFALEHDAAAAHALMQAMDDLEDKIYRKHVRRRADELMRQWGFTDE